MNILGISALYHDSAACLVIDGEIISAAQEERFTRKKHDASIPINAIQYCLREANLAPESIDLIVFYDKPLLKFERLIKSYFASAPSGVLTFVIAIPVWLKDKIFQKTKISNALRKMWGSGVDWKKN